MVAIFKLMIEHDFNHIKNVLYGPLLNRRVDCRLIRVDRMPRLLADIKQ